MLIEYFNEIYTLECEMGEQYNRMSAQLTHHQYRKLFQHLAREEQGHQQLVQTIIDLVGEKENT